MSGISSTQPSLTRSSASPSRVAPPAVQFGESIASNTMSAPEGLTQETRKATPSLSWRNRFAQKWKSIWHSIQDFFSRIRLQPFAQRLQQAFQSRLAFLRDIKSSPAPTTEHHSEKPVLPTPTTEIQVEKSAVAAPTTKTEKITPAETKPSAFQNSDKAKTASIQAFKDKSTKPVHVATLTASSQAVNTSQQAAKTTSRQLAQALKETIQPALSSQQKIGQEISSTVARILKQQPPELHEALKSINWEGISTHFTYLMYNVREKATGSFMIRKPLQSLALTPAFNAIYPHMTHPDLQRMTRDYFEALKMPPQGPSPTKAHVPKTVSPVANESIQHTADRIGKSFTHYWEANPDVFKQHQHLPWGEIIEDFAHSLQKIRLEGTLKALYNKVPESLQSWIIKDEMLRTMIRQFCR